jgi:phage FluMu protein Com
MARPFKKPQEPQTARCPKCRKVWDLTTLRERKDYVPGKCPICKVPLRSIPQRGDEKTKVIPTAKPKRETPGELEYFADSPEFLTQTIDAIGYRDRIDSAFQEAIARARRAHDLTEQIADGSDTGKQKAA